MSDHTDDPSLRKLGLGTAALGRPEYINLHTRTADDLGDSRYDRDTLERHAHGVLDAAWDAGIRHYDTARSYGAGEAFVGSWLAAHPGRREEVRLGSKWGYTYVADFRPGADVHETKDHSLETFERQWAETQEALGGPPDLYLVHSLTSDSPALDDRDLLARLLQLKESGVRVGMSTSGPDQGDVLMRALSLPDCPFTTVQSTWNVLERSVEPALARAHDAGYLVVVKEALANGRLAESDDQAAQALAAAMALPYVDVVLSGASSVEQLHANVAATSYEGEAFDLPPESPEDYWATRKSLAWA
ncbi:aldo/keto reductase [uncultured Nocardioides sp.]|uniref:aldo/keto reductase n=1 Tax=uncultured Nocardioides sp. TaxID=198441 RepID=UPI0026241876|nr:aldo/keto reductase [uncultured Nocardioides sp.]